MKHTQSHEEEHNTAMSVYRWYALVIVAALLLQSLNALSFLNNAVSDMMYQNGSAVSSDICVIGIDEETLTQYGSYYSWVREKTAQLIELLSADPENAPAVIGIDIGFYGDKDIEDDARLAQAVKNAGNVVLSSTATFGESISETKDGFTTETKVVVYETPYEALSQSAASIGFTNLELDNDGFFRHAATSIDNNGEIIPSFAQQVYSLYKGEQPKINSDENGRFYIDFAGEPMDYFGKVGAGSSLYRVLEGEYPVSAFAGKVVLIGAYASGMQDSYLTGINRSISMYGVEIHANILQAFLDNNYKNDASLIIELLITFVLLAAALVLFKLVDFKLAVPIELGAALLYIAAAFACYQLFDIVLAVVYTPLSLALLATVHLIINYFSIREQMQRAHEKAMLIEKDLDFAKTIQHSAVPRVFPAFPERTEFDLYALMDTAKEVGGDLYDYFLIGDDTLGFVIGDVSGKGVPAALFMMRAKYQIKMYITLKQNLNEAFMAVNDSLCEDNEAGMFVTGFGGLLNYKTGELTYVNAGHNYPVIIDAQGECTWLKKKSGPPLAAMEGIPYRLHKTQLNKGDKLYLYTDGVSEAQNKEQELYGDPRLLEMTQRLKQCKVQELLDKALEDVYSFADGAEQADDITMVGIEYIGE